MSGKRAKKLRKEYRVVADEIANSDVKKIITALRWQRKLYRRLTIFMFFFSLMLMGVIYAFSLRTNLM